MTYVMSDIHGRYDLFLKMLEEINFTDEDNLWILGDVVDRGKESIKTLLHIINTNNIYMILGNHEEFMIDFFNRKNIPKNMGELYILYDTEMWLKNGGMDTIVDLKGYSYEIKENILLYLQSLPIVQQIAVGDNLFFLAHADLQFSGEIPLQTPLKYQDRDFVLWNRRIKSDIDTLPNNMYLITGHTPSHMIVKNKSWFCIDCGAVFTNTLGCLRLDDFKEFYVNSNNK